MTTEERRKQKDVMLEEKGKQLSEQAKINHRLGRELKVIQKALNSGEPVDTDAIAQRLEAIAEEQRAQKERLKDFDVLRETPFEVPPEDKEFVLQGYPIPSPYSKFLYETDLHISSMFTVFDDEETQELFITMTGGAFDEEITEHGHVRFVETMFSDTFDDDIAFIVMNAFFWVLHFKGGTWLPVRSYAIEMLKLFPMAILEQYPIPESFIEAFSRFTRKILSSRGICSLKARPTSEEVKRGLYAIKATDAFKSLLEPTAKAMTKTLGSTPE